MKKLYNAAPLPFVGQKRNFIRQYKEILNNVPQGATIVDLFGGSGLLSHVAKRMRPDCRVIYNDFDNFEQRLNAVQTTNKLLRKIRPLVAEIPKHKRISKEVAERIFNVVEEEEQRGSFVDYITLSSSLLFSMNYVTSLADLRKETLWQCVKKADYVVDDYLDDLEVVRMDYRDLFEQQKATPNVIFLVDPPYLSTDCSTYTMRWTVADYLDVLNILAGHRFIYFTSNKSHILELCEWLGRNPTLGNPFSHCTKVEFQAKVNYAAGYTDIMLYN